MKKHTLIMMACLASAGPTLAAEFCVTSSAGLHSALSSAESNNQHNVIKMAEGTYLTNGVTFEYDEDLGWDLTVSGGWTNLLGDPCGQPGTGNPLNTVLDGNLQGRIMSIQSGGSSDITISNLLFLNGGTDTLNSAGGLRFWSTNSVAHTGRTTIERNAFINNHAEKGSALAFFSSGPKSYIRNNIFNLNQTHDGNYTVEVNQDVDSGIYVNNNTLVQNQGNSNNNYGGIVIFTTATSDTYVGNNVLYDNGNRDLHISGAGDVYVHYNDVGIQTGSTPISSQGNFSADPQFNVGIFEFTPSYGSPLVNAGFDPPNAVPIPTPFHLAWFEGTLDVLGNTRKQLGRVDLGAVETAAEPPIFMHGFE